MERKLARTYNEARTELTEEWQAFMKKQEPKVKDAYEDLQKALQTGDTQTIFDARVYYQRVMMNTTIRNNRYRGMVNNLTSKIADVNKTALDYVNGNMANIYTINYNAFSNENIKGYSFDLINENAIRELMTTDKILVPTKKLNVSKDRAWNAKFINSQVTQGIMQGESIDKIAKRILPEIISKSSPDLIKRNKAAAIRNARTMTTAAENKGRQDSFKKAQSDGVIMTRTWVATHDERTRAWHSDMDGVETTVDEPWENDYGEIMYPGDPAAHPANVYNCRCSIRAHVKGFKWNGEEPKRQAEEGFKENIVAGVDINTPQYDVFSEDFQGLIPQLANDIENSNLPDFDTLFDLYGKAETPEDKELVKFVQSLESNVQTYKNESDDTQKYHAEIFSVLSKPHDGALYRGESGEWVKHYGDFAIGKEISFEHLSFTTPDLYGTPSHHSGVIFEFESGTKSINFVGQDNVENDELILGNFIIKSVEDFNGVPKVLLGHGGNK